MPELIFNVIKRPNVIADLNSSFAYQTLTGKLDKKTFAKKITHFFPTRNFQFPLIQQNIFATTQYAAQYFTYLSSKPKNRMSRYDG